MLGNEHKEYFWKNYFYRRHKTNAFSVKWMARISLITGMA